MMRMSRSIGLIVLLWASAAPAQHAGHGAPPAEPAAADPHAGHNMSGMTTAPAGPAGTDLEPGSAPAPAPPADHYADRFWSPQAMSQSRGRMLAEHGGMTMSRIMFNLAEYRPEGSGYRWDAEGWFGGDLNRLVVKSEGEGSFGKPIEQAEIQLLFSRAIDAYWNLQAGIRYDAQRAQRRGYATIGVEGLAPYWFELEGALFLSDKGDLLARIEGYYDQRITQRLILQPRAELDFAAQDIAADRIGKGLSAIELGLRLRYEIVPGFAPYIGVSWERRLGATGRFARADGEDRGGAAAVMGVRFWF